MIDSLFWYFSFFYIFWKLCKSSIKSFFVSIIIFPFLIGFASINMLFIFWFIILIFKMKNRIVWCKCLSRFWCWSKGFQYFSLMYQFLIFLYLSTVIIRSAFIFIGSKQMTNSCISKSFFHFACINIF